MAGRERGRGGSKRTPPKAAPKKAAPKKSVTRLAAVRVRTAKGRKPSSTRWLRRQLNDPYVAEAGRHGYRSRAAWKLIEIDQRFALLRAGATVIDLGAAPGGWTQVAVERIGPGTGRVLAVDVEEMEPIAGADFLRLDLGEADDVARLVGALEHGCDVVLSDMAISATGHRPTDQIRNQRLAEIAYEIAARVLRPRGALVTKAFHGGGAAPLMAALKRDFAEVRTFKPPASRAESAELYIVARGFRAAQPR